jgi:hypothetical protein
MATVDKMADMCGKTIEVTLVWIKEHVSSSAMLMTKERSGLLRTRKVQMSGKKIGKKEATGEGKGGGGQRLC